MRRYSFFRTILLLCSVSAAARAQFVPVVMDSIEDIKSAYMHIGEGGLISMRSAPISWLDCEFTVAEFDSARSILSIEGRITQSNASYDPAPSNITILIGPMPDRDIHGLGNSIQIRERRVLGDGGTFREKIIVRPGDVLCFIPAEPPADSPGERTINSARANVYYVGKLIRDHQGEGP